MMSHIKSKEIYKVKDHEKGIEFGTGLVSMGDDHDDGATDMGYSSDEHEDDDLTQFDLMKVRTELRSLPGAAPSSKKGGSRANRSSRGNRCDRGSDTTTYGQHPGSSARARKKGRAKSIISQIHRSGEGDDGPNRPVENAEKRKQRRSTIAMLGSIANVDVLSLRTRKTSRSTAAGPLISELVVSAYGFFLCLYWAAVTPLTLFMYGGRINSVEDDGIGTLLWLLVDMLLTLLCVFELVVNYRLCAAEFGDLQSRTMHGTQDLPSMATLMVTRGMRIVNCV